MQKEDYFVQNFCAVVAQVEEREKPFYFEYKYSMPNPASSSTVTRCYRSLLILSISKHLIQASALLPRAKLLIVRILELFIFAFVSADKHFTKKAANIFTRSPANAASETMSSANLQNVSDAVSSASSPFSPPANAPGRSSSSAPRHQHSVVKEPCKFVHGVSRYFDCSCPNRFHEENANANVSEDWDSNSLEKIDAGNLAECDLLIVPPETVTDSNLPEHSSTPAELYRSPTEEKFCKFVHGISRYFQCTCISKEGKGHVEEGESEDLDVFDPIIVPPEMVSDSISIAVEVTPSVSTRPSGPENLTACERKCCPHTSQLTCNRVIKLARIAKGIPANTNVSEQPQAQNTSTSKSRKRPRSSSTETEEEDERPHKFESSKKFEQWLLKSLIIKAKEIEEDGLKKLAMARKMICDVEYALKYNVAD